LVPIFFTVNTDGNNTEGIGSVCQHCILIYGIAKKYKVNCGLNNFSNISHWQQTGMTNQEFSSSYTNFFNFPKLPSDYQKLYFNFDDSLSDFVNNNVNSKTNYVIEFDRAEIRRFGFTLFDYFEQNKTFLELKEKLNYNGPNLLDNNFFNVAIRVRRKNQIDLNLIKMWTNSDGEWYQDDFREMYQTDKEAHLFTNVTSNFARYINLFDYLNNKFQKIPVNYHIFSEGNEEDFDNFKNLIAPKDKLDLHLNYHPIHDLWHSINCDFLVMANSSFSWISGLMFFKTKMISRHFGQPNYSDTIYLEKDYTIAR